MQTCASDARRRIISERLLYALNEVPPPSRWVLDTKFKIGLRMNNDVQSRHAPLTVKMWDGVPFGILPLIARERITYLFARTTSEDKELVMPVPYFPGIEPHEIRPGPRLPALFGRVERRHAVGQQDALTALAGHRSPPSDAARGARELRMLCTPGVRGHCSSPWS